MAPTLIVLLAILPIIIIIRVLKHRKSSSNKVHSPPPGPPGLPLIGNLHQLRSSTPHKYLWQLSKTYGPLMSLKLGSVQLLVVSSAKMAEEVLKNHDLIFCSRPPMVGQRKLSYNGIDIAFAPYNDEWREMRKIGVLHLLSNKRVQSYRELREDEVFRMIQKIAEESASSYGTTNLSRTVLSLTSSIICRIAFGKRYDEEGQQRRRFYDLFHEAQAAFVGFHFSDYFPWLGWVDNYTGIISRLEKAFNNLDLFYEELIEEHLHPNRPESMEGDIIDHLLQLREEKATRFDLTMDHIKSLLMNMFIAGADTTGAVVIWAMTALMKSPTSMKKVQSEIREVIGNKKIVDEDDIQNLPYFKAVVKETFRLYPPGPLLVPRQTMGSCSIDGYEIQPKTLVYVNAWAIARDPEYWENPDEFLPERFLNSSIDLKGQDFQVIPFGAGRRGCPGYSLGLITVELILANLLYKFDWELPSGMKKEDIDVDVSPGLTMIKKNDLCLLAKMVEV